MGLLDYTKKIPLFWFQKTLPLLFYLDDRFDRFLVENDAFTFFNCFDRANSI